MGRSVLVPAVPLYIRRNGSSPWNLPLVCVRRGRQAPTLACAACAGARANLVEVLSARHVPPFLRGYRDAVWPPSFPVFRKSKRFSLIKECRHLPNHHVHFSFSSCRVMSRHRPSLLVSSFFYFCCPLLVRPSPPHLGTAVLLRFTALMRHSKKAETRPPRSCGVLLLGGAFERVMYWDRRF